LSENQYVEKGLFSCFSNQCRSRYGKKSSCALIYRNADKGGSDFENSIFSEKVEITK